jgi:phosphoglycolate phosphatase
MSKPDSIIFDLDGTLWDAVETYAMGFNAYFKDHGIEKYFTKQDLQGFMGLEQHAYLQAVLPEFAIHEQNAIYEKVIEYQYTMVKLHGGTLYTGVAEGIPLLAETYRLFIVSNCPADMIYHFLRWSKLEKYFTHTISHGQNHKSKYENIQDLRTFFALRNPIYVGDTYSDYVQSKKAFVPFVFMQYGFGTCITCHKSFSQFQDFLNFYTANSTATYSTVSCM